MTALHAVPMNDRARTDAPARPPAASAPGSPSPAERRLKLVIETAPVSLVITDGDGKVLAANRAALALVGTERLDAVIGKMFSDFVPAEDRDRLAAFISSICNGESGSLQYDLVAPDGSRRTIETRAVPLRREANTPPAFLGAIWDVSEQKRSARALQQMQSKCELLEAQRSAERETLQEALKEAKAAYEKLSSSGRNQIHAEIEEAEARHNQLASQWSVERDGLLARLRESEERHAAVSAQLLIEQNTRQESTEQARRDHQDVLAARTTELAARTAENEQLQNDLNRRSVERDTLEQALRRAEATHEELLQHRNRLQVSLEEAEEKRRHQTREWAAERDELLTTLREIEDRQASLSAQLLVEQNARQSSLEQVECVYQESLAAQQAEKAQLERALGDVRVRYEEMLAESREERETLKESVQGLEQQYAALAEQWQSELADVLCPLKDMSARVEHLLDTFKKRAGSETRWRPAELAQAQPQSSEATSDGGSSEETTWQF